MKIDKKKAIIFSGIFLILLIIVIVVAAIASSRKENVTYRETAVKKGKLTVGVTESGNVNIGISEQTFDLDISEYTESSSSLLQGGMGGGMEMMFGNTGNTSQSSSGRALEIEAVYVSAGQEIEKGDPLLKLTDESVSIIRQALEEDTADAKLTYEQTKAGKEQADLQALADQKVNEAYGDYVEAEYNKTVSGLQDSLEDIQEQLKEAQTQLEEKTVETEEMRVLLSEQQTVKANAEYARDNTSREDSLYWWIVAVNTVSDTEDLIETLEDEIETGEEEIADLTSQITTLSTQLSLAEKSLLTGKAEAEATKNLHRFQYENAQEIYEVATGKSSFEWETAKEDYEEVQAKLDQFDAMIQEGVISSEYAGVISEVGVNAGDSLTQDDSIVQLNDYGEAAITVSVDEEDMASAQIGNAVNIVFAAFPEDVFAGEVTEIGDVEINSNTNATTSSVTVSVTGDVSGLYEGMSAEVTFITEESAEVIYVSNRAVLEEGDSAYVKVRDDNGSIVRKEVTTGFSDGVNTEIKEGLAEGDTVLIESSVK